MDNLRREANGWGVNDSFNWANAFCDSHRLLGNILDSSLCF